MITKTLLIAVASLVLTFAGPACAAGYTVRDIIFPGDPIFTEALGINDAGTIVGTHGAGTNQGFTVSPAGVFSSENFPGSTQTQLLGISANGTVDGIYVDQAMTTHGFVAVPGGMGPTFSTYDQGGTLFNQLLGISADGTRFAGYSSIDPLGMVAQEAYFGSVANKTFTSVNGLLPFNFNSQATGVNNAGTVVGFYMNTLETSIGFEDVGGAITTLDPFGSTNTQALGISTNGEIVGSYVDAMGVQHGYTDINGVFTSFDPAGSFGTTINGVNDLGQLVGFFTDVNDNTIGFEATPVVLTVPEPASLALVGAGVMGVLGVRRRRLG